MAYTPMSVRQFRLKLEQRGYLDAASAKKAVAKTKWSIREKVQQSHYIDYIFGGGTPIILQAEAAQVLPVEQPTTVPSTAKRLVELVTDFELKRVLNNILPTYRQYPDKAAEAFDFLLACRREGIDVDKMAMAAQLDPRPENTPTYKCGKHAQASPTSKAKTQISWVNDVWQPFTGCTPVSAGCANCYAVRTTYERYRNRPWVGDVVTNDGGKPAWTGKVLLLDDQLDMPMTGSKPKRLLVGDRGDLFQPAIPDGYIEKVLAVVRQCPQHTFFFLTKHTKRMEQVFKDEEPLGNVWLGCSVESKDVLFRAFDLARTPAAHRFVSAQPLLSPLQLSAAVLKKIDWLLVGAEVGPGKRNCEDQWLLRLVDQCRKYGVPPYIVATQSGRNLAHSMIDWPLDLRIRELPTAISKEAA
jgi:protein gp37